LTTWNLQNAAEADTGGSNTNDVVVLLQLACLFFVSTGGKTYSLGTGVLATSNVLLAVLLEEVGQAGSTKNYVLVSFNL
jgi:hypothetical protein